MVFSIKMFCKIIGQVLLAWVLLYVKEAKFNLIRYQKKEFPSIVNVDVLQCCWKSLPWSHYYIGLVLVVVCVLIPPG